jgi:N-dimethylarginine dimethylaminohydrolase
MKKWETREWWESRQWSKEDIEEMWQEEKERLSQQPWFESGKPCRTGVFWERDGQEELELTWGKWGAQGIGKLRKVALGRPHEYEINPVFEKEPAYYRLYGNRVADLDKWRKGFDEYVKVLEEEGVEVILWDVPETPIGPYGFLRLFNCVYFLATKAGIIVPRPAMAGWMHMTKWVAEQTIKMGCPILYMMHGKECGEVTPNYLAENSVIINEGMTVNREACNKMKMLLEELGDEVWVAHTPGPVDRWGFPSSGCSHLDWVLETVDLGLALVFPGFLDYSTIRYLNSKKVRLIEISPEEYVQYGVNILLLEPGKIIIPAAAKETIKVLRKEGVECIDIDFSENAMGGTGGPACITARLLRDPGPSLDDL